MHAWAWQDAAYGIENVCRDKFFLNLQLNLSRYESLAQEVLRSSVKMPPGIKLRERRGIDAEPMEWVLKSEGKG